MTPVKHPSALLAVADHLAGESHRAQMHAVLLEAQALLLSWQAGASDLRAEAARYRVAADVLMDEALALLDSWEAGGRRG